VTINPRIDPRLAGEIPRYHTWPHLRTQSIGEHTWQLLRILLAIYPNMPREMMVHVMYHDLGETKTGDAPYPIKKDNPILKSEMDRIEVEALGEMGVYLPPLVPLDKSVMKYAELLEMWEWGLMEEAKGNKLAKLVTDRCYIAAVEWEHENRDLMSARLGVDYRIRRMQLNGVWNNE
jgi:5'-deoxynucleotidase YfbR-like HD superfamily hydrolase